MDKKKIYSLVLTKKSEQGVLNIQLLTDICESLDEALDKAKEKLPQHSYFVHTVFEV